MRTAFFPAAEMSTMTCASSPPRWFTAARGSSIFSAALFLRAAISATLFWFGQYSDELLLWSAPLSSNLHPYLAGDWLHLYADFSCVCVCWQRSFAKVAVDGDILLRTRKYLRKGTELSSASLSHHQISLLPGLLLFMCSLIFIVRELSSSPK